MIKILRKIRSFLDHWTRQEEPSNFYSGMANPRQLWNSPVGQTGDNPQHSITDAELERQMNEFFRHFDSDPERNIVVYTGAEGHRVFQEMLNEEVSLMFGQTLTEASEPISLNLDFMQVQSVFKPTIDVTPKLTLPSTTTVVEWLTTEDTSSFTYSDTSILPF